MQYPSVNPKTLSQLSGYLGLSDNVFRKLLSVASERKTVWLLGAGASYPTRPMWEEHRNNLIEACLDLPGWPAVTPPCTSFKSGLLYNLGTEDRLTSWKRWHTPDDFFRAHYESGLLGSETEVEPQPQFQFFKSLPNSNAIFSTNQDGLVHHFWSNVLCIHGCVYEGFGFGMKPEEVRGDAMFMRDLRCKAATEWDFDPGPAPWLYMPGDPISDELFEKVGVFTKHVASCSALIVVGYSFSDPHIFEMLTDVMRHRGEECLTFVIDPDPKIDQAERLREFWRSHNVHRISMGWHSLTAAIQTVSTRQHLSTFASLPQQIDEICCQLQVETGRFPMDRKFDPWEALPRHKSERR